MHGPFMPPSMLASREKQTADLLFHKDGTRTINCPKHGWTGCAGRGGWDDRCGKCVLESLTHGPVEVKPFPKVNLGGIFFMEFKYDPELDKVDRLKG